MFSLKEDAQTRLANRLFEVDNAVAGTLIKQGGGGGGGKLTISGFILANFVLLGKEHISA